MGVLSRWSINDYEFWFLVVLKIGIITVSFMIKWTMFALLGDAIVWNQSQIFFHNLIVGPLELFRGICHYCELKTRFF